MADPVEAYLTELRDIHRSGAGVKETSYYAALSNLVNEIGRKLKPRVRCIINLQNAGAGIPDGGFFTPDQFPRSSKEEPRAGQMPSRGALEVKGADEDVSKVADRKQVRDYLAKYRQVLVTSYRDFLLLGYDHEGQPTKYESYSLAEDEGAFWSAVAHPRKMAEEHGERLTEYLKRAMLRRAELVEPKDVAWFLASYAREARARVEARKDLPELAAIRAALEDALGMKFEGEKGEHFFRSTLVQTLFYGVFSAWVLWDKQHKGDPTVRFNWHEAGWYLHVPMINALFQQISSPAQLGPLDIAEVLDWAGDTLNRVNRGEFFSKFEEGHAVQYFYEPFLQAFDPELRKELGVWYTPPEIVQYMVERVDRVLRSELGIADGLADPNVYVLDPCCGTGAYLVEVLNRIQKTLRGKGGDALVAQDLKKAAMERVFGFEILPAPFVIAHLQLGLLLQNLGAPLADERAERAGVYLTNALTGWEPPEHPKEQVPFAEIEQERKAAEKVKREAPILVIIGNPPYNGFAGVSPAAERGLVETYKEGLISEWGIKKFNLDDLYVRFFRLAEQRIAEKTGRGVVCYISNFSYLDDVSFVTMRQRFLGGFQRMWFDCMNGDSRETGKRTPDGKPDPSVFSSDHNTPGIRVGTVVALMVRKTHPVAPPRVLFRHFWGVTKRADLLASLRVTRFDSQYEAAAAEQGNRFSFVPQTAGAEYGRWPKLSDLWAEASNGLMEKRRGALIDIDKAALESRLKLYYDTSVDLADLRETCAGLAFDVARFDASKTRNRVTGAGAFDPSQVKRYAVRPLETRWSYYSPIRPLWNEPRPSLWRQCWEGNSFFLTRFRRAKSPEGPPFYFTSCLSDDHLLAPDAVAVPLRLVTDQIWTHSTPRARGQLISGSDPGKSDVAANISSPARAYLASLTVTNFDADEDCAALIWMHALAIGYAPTYLAENDTGVARDYPRIPLPDSKEALLTSAELGKKIAALLDTETEVAEVTSGNIRPELREIAVISREGGGALDPATGDLAVKAGWGHSGKGGATMPGSGRLVKRPYSPEEVAAIATEEGAGAEASALRMGESTLDVYLNDVAYWRNVPERVWEYRIGGYQVIKKWLSYREEKLLGRSLSMDEAREVTNMARRIAAILLLEPALDENYARVKAATYPWPKAD
jgi:hypothetical protein